ncbi:hypothetical protein Tco_0974566 [Tanacetum coccineum]|uniref:Uncharacterized protein n=1 Tax=Tanacetum coccineum TaxID=301880 RepID=A0ABQ5EBY1_9ASTR
MLSSLSIRQRQTNEWMRWRRSLTKDVEGSNKLHPGTTNDMNDERLKPHTEPHTDSLFVEGMQPTGFGREFGVDPQAAVDREMRHMIETNQRGEREHRGVERARGAGIDIKQETDSHVSRYSEHSERGISSKMPLILKVKLHMDEYIELNGI